MPRAPNNSGRKRGRPPNFQIAPTELGRWIKAHGMSLPQFATHLFDHANDAGVDPDHMPSAASMKDLVAGRYAPSAIVMLGIRHATDGAVDLQHWVRDLFYAHAGARSAQKRSRNETTDA